MRHLEPPTAQALSVLLCAVLAHGVVTAQDIEEAAGGLVDFRMTPLEQARKIFLLVRAGSDARVTLTVMNRLTPGQDGRHLIVGEEWATAEYLRGQLGPGGVDSVSWTPRTGAALHGTCDTQDECENKTDDMCKKAGHGGAKAATVKISIHSDGSKTCSASCKNNGAVAFVTCSPEIGLHTIVDEPDPVSQDCRFHTCKMDNFGLLACDCIGEPE